MRALLTPAGACVFTINFVIPIIMLVAFVAMTTVQRAGAGRQDGAGGATGAADDGVARVPRPRFANGGYRSGMV